MKTVKIPALLCLAMAQAVLLFWVSPAAQAQVELSVPGWSDPWLAGMPEGSSASCDCGCDYAPQQSPQLVNGLALVAGDVLTFAAAGGVANDPQFPLDPPDGNDYIAWHDSGAENGISDVRAPANCLVGVFLTDEEPDSSPAPSGLDFSSPESRDYLTLSPLLKQVFFIGDGLTSGGAIQGVVVPAAARRLFLGTLDSCGWYNNIGSFDVSVTESGPVPISATTWGLIRARYR
jgi:hypothetical protein